MPSVPIAVPLYFDAEISEIVVKTTGATIPPKAPIKSLVTKKTGNFLKKEKLSELK